MTRIVAPSRLHFGLLNLPTPGLDRWPGLDDAPGLAVRHFGGLGLMIDRPGISLRVQRASEWAATGPLANRALEFAHRFAASIGDVSAWRIEIESAAPEHAGLGVGTQLGLAVARAMANELGRSDLSTAELATRVGRGERSAIGIHGFEGGGLIVEGGKGAGETISPLVGRFRIPEEWAIVLVSPDVGSGWHGAREREAFASLGPSLEESATLCRLVLMGVLPALASRNLDEFGESVYEFNARVGEVFASAQGGRYSSPAVASAIAGLRKIGVKGVGQSSWGPSVFAIVRREDAERVAAQANAPAIVAGASDGSRID